VSARAFWPRLGGVGRSRCLRALVPVLLAADTPMLAACGSSSHDPLATRHALQGYLLRVEPIRLAVNSLLETADPILTAYRDRRLSPAEAGRRMDRLERRFAAYAVDVAAIEAPPQLRALHAEYAHTYVFEDAYLSALAAGLAQGDLGNLPNTQAVQRAAIIAWRIGLTVLARRSGTALPADLQQAGRGEVAPAPGGS
jgi:hypothetical protein